jgi:hypothetical protein
MRVDAPNVRTKAGFHDVPPRSASGGVTCDNCAKSICDALNGIVYLDDSQIVELVIRRHVDRERPRAEVTVERAGIEPRASQ